MWAVEDGAFTPSSAPAKRPQRSTCPPRRSSSRKRPRPPRPRPHNSEFLDELTAFPHTKHDDCVDALAGAHSYLSQTNPGRAGGGFIRTGLSDLREHGF